jgi:hypothetical protein
VKQAGKIVTQIKNETASLAPKEDGVSTNGRAAASGAKYGQDWTQLKSVTANVAPKEDGLSTHGRDAASGMESSHGWRKSLSRADDVWVQ